MVNEHRIPATRSTNIQMPSHLRVILTNLTPRDRESTRPATLWQWLKDSKATAATSLRCPSSATPCESINLFFIAALDSALKFPFSLSPNFEYKYIFHFKYNDWFSHKEQTIIVARGRSQQNDSLPANDIYRKQDSSPLCEKTLIMEMSLRRVK